jgi:hypothetical protein
MRLSHGTTLLLMALAMLGLAVTGARAVPSFAVQTGQPCQACHVGGFGPQLTPFGRNFKLNGYTSRSAGFTLPVSAMVVASYTSTAKAPPPPPTPGFATNDNFAVDQVGLFIAGGVGHIGGFIQTTYDGVSRSFHWDNLDVRAIEATTLGGKSAVFGLSLNNAPTVEDVWNTLPSWGFPYTTSELAPAPGASPIIGGFAQNTLGITGYAWLDKQFYVELGGYRSPSAGFLTHAGVDPTDPGSIKGTAPYARIAWQKSYPASNFELGAFLMNSHIYPGLDNTTGQTDHYFDVGLDASYQLFASHNNVVTLNARWTHETQDLVASQLLGNAANVRQTLQDFRMDASYYWHNQIGFTAQVFDTWGTSDPLLYAGNANPRPNSSGFMLQLDGTPWGAAGSPLGPRFNMRLGIQYTNYFNFNGLGVNYDGMGRNAADNNTFRVFAWFAY